jgi:hypothetical protein
VGYIFEVRCILASNSGDSAAIIYSVDSEGQIESFYKSLLAQRNLALGSVTRAQGGDPDDWLIPNQAHMHFRFSLLLPVGELNNNSRPGGFPSSVVEYFTAKGFVAQKCVRLSCVFAKPGLFVWMQIIANESANDSNVDRVQAEGSVFFHGGRTYDGDWFVSGEDASDLVRHMPFRIGEYSVSKDW